MTSEVLRRTREFLGEKGTGPKGDLYLALTVETYQQEKGGLEF